MLLLPGGINASIHAPYTVQEASECQGRETGFLHLCHMAWLLLSDLFPRSNCDKNRQGYSQGPMTDLCISTLGTEPSSQCSSPVMHR